MRLCLTRARLQLPTLSALLTPARTLASGLSEAGAYDSGFGCPCLVLYILGSHSGVWGSFTWVTIDHPTRARGYLGYQTPLFSFVRSFPRCSDFFHPSSTFERRRVERGSGCNPIYTSYAVALSSLTRHHTNIHYNSTISLISSMSTTYSCSLCATRIYLLHSACAWRLFPVRGQWLPLHTCHIAVFLLFLAIISSPLLVCSEMEKNMKSIIT